MSPTVAQLLAAYCADREPLVVDVPGMERRIRQLCAGLGRLPVCELTHDAVRAYTAARVSGGVLPQTVRRELIVLKAALRCAYRAGTLAQVPHIPMPAPGAPRQRVLSAEEIRRLRVAAADDAPLSLFIDLALSCGARLSALAELTWDRIDLERGTLDLRAPHPRAARRKQRAVVPIAGPLRERLTRLREERQPATGDRVIGLGAHAISRHFRAAARRANLLGATPHVLRHVVATELLRHVPLVMASRMLGHRSVAITEQVYAHLTTGDLRPAAQALECHLVPLAGPTASLKQAAAARNGRIARVLGIFRRPRQPLRKIA